MRENTIKINVETEGFEKTIDQVEQLADAFDGFPAQVVLKNCRDCTFNIFPTQKIVVLRGEQE